MKKYFFAAIAAGLAFVLAGLLLYQSSRITTLESTVEDVYLSALHQSAEEMDELTLHMEKALLTTDPVHAVTLLHTVGQTADSVRQHLSFLPVEHQTLAPALLFANQLSDYAGELLPRLVEQGALNSGERVRLEQLLALCSQLGSQLAMADATGDLSALHLEMPIAASAPVQAKGLPQGEITQEEALSIARSFVGDNRVISVKTAPGTSGSLAAYGVTVETPDVQLNLEVTRQGGKVLWMMPETASFPVAQSPQTCREAAAAFLEWQGFPFMEPVYHEVYDGLCVISLTPVQEEVLLYPDLIRVQVRMDTAEVVGVETHNYWLNHVRRELPVPSLTAEQARSPVDGHAQVLSSRLCLIPSGDTETLCYELSVSHEGENYLIYIDARSGHEVELLKTIPLENGVRTA
ncbi:MAG: hypothetical protein E7316_05455 [Clostridiales bacterium]|nr:hypothetical protein [Clostridiales bacterium]